MMKCIANFFFFTRGTDTLNNFRRYGYSLVITGSSGRRVAGRGGVGRDAEMTEMLSSLLLWCGSILFLGDRGYITHSSCEESSYDSPDAIQILV